MQVIIEVIGWAAAGVLLGAYLLLSRGKISGQASSFQTLNVVGSLLVGVNSFVHKAWPSVSVNAVWLLIGVASLAASRRHGRPTPGGRGAADGADGADGQPSGHGAIVRDPAAAESVNTC